MHWFWLINHFDTDIFHLKVVACQFDLDFHKVILGSLLQGICVPHTIHLALPTCNHNSLSMFSLQFSKFWAALRKLEFASQHIRLNFRWPIVSILYCYTFKCFTYIIISARVEHYIWICTLKHLPIFFLFKWIFKVSETKIVLNFNLYINVTDSDQDHNKQIPWYFLLFNLIEKPKCKNTWYCRCTCFQY